MMVIKYAIPMDKWQDRIKLLKKTTAYINYPKHGFITKSISKPKESMRQPINPKKI